MDSTSHVIETKAFGQDVRATWTRNGWVNVKARTPWGGWAAVTSLRLEDEVLRVCDTVRSLSA